MSEKFHQRLIHYSEAEEVFNRWTHGLGAVASLVGLILLVVASSRTGEPRLIVSCTLYGFCLTLFYSFSTLYHTFRNPRVRYVFRILDHVGIFLVIAGTYTPFTLVTMNGSAGWRLFAIVWGLAVTGIVFKSIWPHRLRIVAPLLYLALGWLVVAFLEPLRETLPEGGLPWLVAGGLFYSVGLIFYASRAIPHNHGIWHIFVLAGTLCHYLAVYWYVVPV